MAQPIQIQKVRGLKTLVETEEAGSIESVPIDDLSFDFSYQRGLNMQLVQDMANNWDPMVAGAIVVSRRNNGDLYVVDGQHRTAAAKMRGDTHILAQVVSNRGPVNEATMRLKGNVRRSDAPMERFRAQLAAGDKQSKALVELLEAFDTKINITPMADAGINAVSCVEKLYRQDEGVLLARVFEVIQRAFGVVGGKNANSSILQGLGWMLTVHEGDVNVARLIERLQLEGTASLDRIARSHRAAMGGSMWLNWYKAALEVYNRGLPGGAKLDFTTRVGGGRRRVAAGGDDAT